MKSIHLKLLICTAVVASAVLGVMWFESQYGRGNDEHIPQASQEANGPQMESNAPYPTFKGGEIITIIGTYVCYMPDTVTVEAEKCIEGFITDDGDQYILDWSEYLRHGWEAESGTRAKLTGRILPGTFSGPLESVLLVDLVEKAD